MTDRSVPEIDAVITLLEQRVRTARMANDEHRDRIAEDVRAEVPAMSAEEMARERIEYRCASARWTEAQEALAVVRRALGPVRALVAGLDSQIQNQAAAIEAYRRSRGTDE